MGNGADTGAGTLFTGAGGALTTISLDSLSMFNGIDDSGRVAFLANPAVQTGDGGPVTTIATRTFEGGAYQQFYRRRSVNQRGRQGGVHGLPAVRSGGVFTGPDPEADVVLKTGDPLSTRWRRSRDGDERRHHARGHQRQRSGCDGGRVQRRRYRRHQGIAIVRADPPNRPPVASDDSFSVTAGGSVSDTFSATDPDSEPITYSIVTNGAKGTAVLDNASTGAFTYTANANAGGDDTFTFKATDNRGLESNVATITVAIQIRCRRHVP